MVQSCWLGDLVFVASQRISSVDWLSPEPGTISVTAVLEVAPWLSWVLVVVLILCGTVWWPLAVVISTFSVTWQWWATMLEWMTLDWGCYCSRSRSVGWFVTQSGFEASYIDLLQISSYVGENKEFERQYLKGELEVELTPQVKCELGLRIWQKWRLTVLGYPGWASQGRRGWSSSILHAYRIWHPRPWGGSTKHFKKLSIISGRVTHQVCPWWQHCYPLKAKVTSCLWSRKLSIAVIGQLPREERVFNGRNYIMEEGITGDFALVKAWKADKAGNLVFRMTANNFNLPMAKAAKITIAEVEEVVEVGEIPPDQVTKEDCFHCFHLLFLPFRCTCPPSMCRKWCRVPAMRRELRGSPWPRWLYFQSKGVLKPASCSDNREQQGVEPSCQDEGEDCEARCLRVQGRNVRS